MSKDFLFNKEKSIVIESKELPEEDKFVLISQIATT